MNIRPATAADLPAISALQARSRRDSYGERFFKNLFGYDVSIIKINWPNIATISEQTEGICHA